MKFEDFTNSSDNDIFNKALKASEFLNKAKSNCELTGTEYLGVQLLEKSCPELNMRNLDGQDNKVIMLGSNSYLNLTTHPQVVEGARKALEKYGYGMGAVSLYAGITDLHKELEYRIAKFCKAEDAVLFPSGYGTNIGVISALCGENDIVINDSANHASIFDGCKLSGAEIKVYPHSNIKYLEKILKNTKDENKGKLIITDGVFSMHGDLAKLDEIVDLAQKYNARLMVDDAHGLGIVGETGKGTAEVFNCHGKIDLNVGMLSKTPGAIGGYCATTKEVAQYLRLYARTYFFSTAIPAPVIGGLVEVFKLLDEDKAGRDKLWKNINYFKSELIKRKFDVGETQSGIIPIIVGNEEKLFRIHQSLLKDGVYTNIVTYPAVRRKECRLRICMMKDLSKEQLDKTLNIITQKGIEYGLIE